MRSWTVLSGGRSPSIIEGMSWPSPWEPTKGTFIAGPSPLAIQRLKTAVAQAEMRSHRGEHLHGQRLLLHPSREGGRETFVCGEETALMASIEGRRSRLGRRPGQLRALGMPHEYQQRGDVGQCSPDHQSRGSPGMPPSAPKNPRGQVFALTGKVEAHGSCGGSRGITLRDHLRDRRRDPG